MIALAASLSLPVMVLASLGVGLAIAVVLHLQSEKERLTAKCKVLTDFAETAAANNRAMMAQNKALQAELTLATLKHDEMLNDKVVPSPKKSIKETRNGK